MPDLTQVSREIGELADAAFENGAQAMRLRIMKHLDLLGMTRLAQSLHDLALPKRGEDP